MIQFVWLQQAFNAAWDDESLADENEETEETFSFSKLAQADHANDDFSIGGSTVSSMTMSACSRWGDGGEVRDEMSQASSASIEVHHVSSSSASMLERKAPEPLLKTSHSRRHSAPPVSAEAVTLAELRANLDTLMEEYGKDHALVAQTWNLIGNALYRDQEYKHALCAYKEAVLCCDTGVHLADAYANIGKAYLALDNIEESVDFLLRSLEAHKLFAVALDRDLSMSLQVAEIHHNLGLALTEKGDFDGAMVSLHKSRAIRERVAEEEDCHEDIAKTMNAIGAICLLEEDPKCALLCHEEALHILEQQENCQEVLAKTLCNIAAVHHANDDRDAAISTYKQAIETQKACLLLTESNAIRKDIAVTLVSLADLLVESNQESAARDAFFEAKKLNKIAGLDSTHPIQRNLRTKIFRLN